VKILAPADKTATGAETIFAWEPDAPLAEGQLYEVAFWRPNDSQESAQAWRDATQNTQIQIFPDGRSGTYNWGVWLGRMGSTGKYERLKYLGGGYEFTISSESGGSDDSGEGSGSSDTGGK
jgi:hypothetical protein